MFPFGSIIWFLFYSFCSFSCISNYKACKSCKQIYLIWFSAFWIINHYNIWHFSFKNCIHLYSLPKNFLLSPFSTILLFNLITISFFMSPNFKIFSALNFLYTFHFIYTFLSTYTSHLPRAHCPFLVTLNTTLSVRILFFQPRIFIISINSLVIVSRTHYLL